MLVGSRLGTHLPPLYYLKPNVLFIALECSLALPPGVELGPLVFLGWQCDLAEYIVACIPAVGDISAAVRRISEVQRVRWCEGSVECGGCGGPLMLELLVRTMPERQTC